MKNLFKISSLLLVVSILFFTSCDKEDHTVTYTDVMASQIKINLVVDASITPYEKIFDVSPAYDQGHLPFGTNAGNSILEAMLSGLDKIKSYLVYCHGDAPAMAGTQIM